MSIVRVGSTKKYADGWEKIFGKGKKNSRKGTKSKSTTGSRSCGRTAKSKRKTAKKRKRK